MAELQEIVVAQPGELASCCTYLAGCPEFGFDTEFVGEDTYHPRLCLVQVAAPDRLFLIDPLSAGPLDGFWNLVVDPRHQVIVHAGREEVRLCHLWSGKIPGNLFDLQIAAGMAGYPYPLSHGSLVSQLLGIQLTKGETLTEWRTRPLTRAQIRYAFDDVRFLLPLWQQLSGQLAQFHREDWAREEFHRLAANATSEEPAVAKWRKLRGLGTLDRRRLAVARDLYHWREELAARTNRPARTIVRDDLIVEIARRNPAREKDLHVVRGLPRRDLDRIFQVVEGTRSLPPEDLPAAVEREQDLPQVALVASVLLAVLGDLSSRLHLAPNLVAATNDVKLLVRSRLQGNPPPAESFLAQGWRSRHILPELQAVLEGRRSIRITDLKREAPFEVLEVPPG